MAEKTLIPMAGNLSSGNGSDLKVFNGVDLIFFKALEKSAPQQSK